MNTFNVSIFGIFAGVVTASDAQSAMRKGASSYNGGNTQGVSVEPRTESAPRQGQSVNHKYFGEGIITELRAVSERGNDFLCRVQFATKRVWIEFSKRNTEGHECQYI